MKLSRFYGLLGLVFWVLGVIYSDALMYAKALMLGVTFAFVCGMIYMDEEDHKVKQGRE